MTNQQIGLIVLQIPAVLHHVHTPIPAVMNHTEIEIMIYTDAIDEVIV
jgi:hypothetical protein